VSNDKSQSDMEDAAGLSQRRQASIEKEARLGIKMVSSQINDRPS